MVENHPNLIWPTPKEYSEAIQYPDLAFRGQEDLENGSPELQSKGMPKSWSGEYACVFKVNCENKPYAVRCFQYEVPKQEERYAKLCDYLEQHENELPIGKIVYIKKGILVKGNWRPILKMDWVEGKTLDEFIGENINNSGIIQNLAEDWRRVVAKLNNHHIAHGDLQNRNILVSQQGGIILVDFDCMYIPEFNKFQWAKESPEPGHRHYQHPKRTTQSGEWLDNFSSLVIYISLLALCKKPSLWKDYHEEVAQEHDQHLILKRADFENPEDSPNFKQLEAIPYELVRILAIKLRGYCNQPIDQTPALEVVLERAGVSSLNLVQDDMVGKTQNGSLEQTNHAFEAQSTEEQPMEDYRGIPQNHNLNISSSVGANILGKPRNQQMDDDQTRPSPLPLGNEYLLLRALNQGERVAHPMFGIGTVIKVTPSGDDTIANINFEEVGEKRLLLSVARLQML